MAVENNTKMALYGIETMTASMWHSMGMWHSWHGFYVLLSSGPVAVGLCDYMSSIAIQIAYPSECASQTQGLGPIE